jgi:hypothetical protein
LSRRNLDVSARRAATAAELQVLFRVSVEGATRSTKPTGEQAAEFLRNADAVGRLERVPLDDERQSYISGMQDNIPQPPTRIARVHGYAVNNMPSTFAGITIREH